MKVIKIGISSCLMGLEVRHDGGHKRSKYVMQSLADHFELTPFCPELAAGLGVPRASIRLAKNEFGVRLVGVKDSSNDITEHMRDVSKQQITKLDDLSGYILKKDSPTCGMSRVKVWNENGRPNSVGTGVFASELMRSNPDLPIEEEGRLMDGVLRENFIERVYVYSRWQELLQSGLTVRGLIEFHSKHKFALLAHDESVYRELGPLVASVEKGDVQEVAKRYIHKLMQGMKRPATRKRHVNVLMHVVGFLKQSLSRSDKQEMQEILDNYRSGIIPLVVPMALLKHHLRRIPTPYIENQSYLDPYPESLMLRNSL